MVRIAVPVLGESFCAHFGRCDGFLLCDLDAANRRPDRSRIIARPKQRCESVPAWLRQLGVTTVVAGGLGAVARRHLEQLGIVVSVGHQGADPQRIIESYIARPLAEAENPCPTFEHRHHHCNG